MVLPAAGNAIRMAQINTELGRSAGALISLDTAENGGYATINIYSPSRPNSANPASMSEWYNYNHTATTTTTTTTTTAAPGTCYNVQNTGPFTSNTIQWTSVDGVGRSGTLAGNGQNYICSTTVPFENPAVDVNVTSCGTSCSNNCTAITCKGCAC